MRKIENHELGRPSVDAFASMAKMPVVAVLDNVRSAQNAGAFFRTADAFALQEIVLAGITAVPPSKEIHKSALGAEMTVRWRCFTTSDEAIQTLKDEGFTIIVIEQVEGAVMLNKFELDSTKKYALVFGNEVEGVQQSVVDMADQAIEIPQVGTKHSINVSVAGGVVMWHFFEQWKK